MNCFQRIFTVARNYVFCAKFQKDRFQKPAHYDYLKEKQILELYRNNVAVVNMMLKAKVCWPRLP